MLISDELHDWDLAVVVASTYMIQHAERESAFHLFNFELQRNSKIGKTY